MISTAGIALQQQLVQKDLPYLTQHLWPHMVEPAGVKPQELPPTYGLLKGVGNYVCRLKRAELPQRTPGMTAGFFKWSAADTVGDRETAPPHTDDVWSRVSVSSEECRGTECPQAANCGAMASRREAKMHDIVITNHHFLACAKGDNPALIQSTGVRPRPPARYEGSGKKRRLLILDEAHEYPNIALDVQGFSISRRMLLSRTPEPDPEQPELEEWELLPSAMAKVTTAWRAVREAISNLFERFRGASAHLLLGQTETLGLFRADLTSLLSRYRSYRSLLESSGEDESSNQWEKTDTLCKRIESWIDKIPHLSGAVLAQDESGNEVLHGVATQLTPPDTAFIAVSATLRYEGKYNHWLERVGVEPSKSKLLPEVRGFTTPSPFNWPEQCLLIQPSDARNPADDPKGYIEYLKRTALETVRRSQGRALILCSSWSHVQAISEHLVQAPYRVLVQGTQGKQQLVDEFKSDISSVLVGTTSFWTGVDVPGEALSALLIDKLPFRSKDNPLTTILKLVDGKDYFGKHVLPETAALFAQGFGRLIRSVNDKGVVVLCDRRLFTQGYSRAFLSQLPRGLIVHQDLKLISPFLGVDPPEELEPEHDRVFLSMGATTKLELHK